jgi:hypothetical protein
VDEVAWEITHSIDTTASLPFAWAYMTNVANWDDPPATFELEGPFTAGSRGITRTPGQEPRHWQLIAVTPLESYVMETRLDRASMSFEWKFEALAGGGARLTQHIVLEGVNAAAYVEPVRAAFGSSLAPGMNRIATAIEVAEARARRDQNQSGKTSSTSPGTQ